MFQRQSPFWFYASASCVLAMLALPSSAQQPPNPRAPQLAMPMPMGMQRGSSMELILTGANLDTPTGFWISAPGVKVAIPVDNNNGKDPAKLRVLLEVPKETPLGFHAIRLATKRGLSNLRLFCIDDLPQVLEVDTNRAKVSAQAVPVPCVVAARADAEISDYFKISVTAGQRVSFEVLGHRLGSPFDPQLTLFDGKTLRELPAGHSNDAPGLQTDSRLTYTFKDAGEYLIEIRDVMFRGGPDYCYRLRIGDFPCATSPIPMAGKRGGKTLVNFAGPTIDGVAPIEVAVPADPQTSVVWVAPKGANGLYGWPVALAVSDLDEVLEQEPNNETAKANRVPMPGAITARFQEKGDVDHFVFAAKKGQRIIIEAQTRELYSPTEVYMILKNSMGGELLKTNPTTAPRLDFTAQADGDFYLVVEHLLYWGGPAESYRVSIKPYEPDFDLTLLIDRYDVPQGQQAAINVVALRRDYTGPIELSVAGNPGLTGTATIAEGQAGTLVFISSKPDLPSGLYQVTLQGKATIAGKVVTKSASVRASLSLNLGKLAHPPLHLLDQVGVAITAKPPFTLVAKFESPETIRGGVALVTIAATRDTGFTEEITLAALGLPPNVAPALKNIPKGQNEIKLELKPAANAPLGNFTIAFAGRTKFMTEDYQATSAPAALVLVLPFDLQVDPKPVTIAQGAKVKLKITAVRKAGYQGPINVTVRNLPANVIAPNATIAMGQPSVEIELTAGLNAVATAKADVDVLGTATAAANQQNASPKLVLTVQATALFDLQINPNPLKIVQGGKAKLNVTAVRKAGYLGPIALELRNLPANVTAPKATIPQGQNVVEIEVTVAANAAVADKADINILGTAAAAANQQTASPNFTLGVTKK